jgi:hypothetical protein
VACCNFSGKILEDVRFLNKNYIDVPGRGQFYELVCHSLYSAGVLRVAPSFGGCDTL